MSVRSGGRPSILVTACAVLILACSSPAPSPAPDVEAPFPTNSALGRLFAQIDQDGLVSKDVALQAFSLSIEPLPGVTLPDGGASSISESLSGSFAWNWLLPYYDELTAEQKAVVDRLLTPDPGRIIVTPDGQARTALLSAGLFSREPTAEEKFYIDLLEQANLIIASKLGRKLGYPYSLTLNDTHQDPRAGALAYASPLPGRFRRLAECGIHVEPELRKVIDKAVLASAMAHEMFHCFQFDALDKIGLFWTARANWIIEGEAAWVGEAAMGPSTLGRDWWGGYLLSPPTALFARAYDAIGFYEHMFETGADPWKLLDPILLAANNVDSYKAAGAPQNNFLDSWSSGLFRESLLGQAWNAAGPWQTQLHAAPDQVTVANGDSVPVSAGYVANSVIRVKASADIVETRIIGHGRLRAGSVDDIGLEQRFYCTKAGGCRPCPQGKHWTGPDVVDIPPDISLALTGSLDTTNGQLIGHSQDEYCQPDSSFGPPRPSGPPCTAGCGGSNGDPHLKTVDGSRYDLQSAGEYVMLRAPDGSLEIQARQEPRGASATINTAVAARVNDHRVGFYMVGEGVPEVRVDGTVVPPDGIGGIDLGPDATLAAFQRGYQLDFPDGTTLWALSLGTWGINVLVLPNDSLRADGVGIIARVPSDARFRIPALPDGTQLPAPANRDERYQALYGTFAPAWRVTADDTLFDYEEDQTTDSYTVADFPPQTAPLDVSELDPDDFAAAQLTCGVVTDADLAEQCAFDVVVTGEEEFVTLYMVSDELETQGTSTLSEPPPTVSVPETPAPTGGPLPSGINFVADHILGVSSRALAPNGNLYAMVATAEAAFGDVKYTLLEIDPATGQIVQQVDSHGPGMLAWAADSLWAGEFSRPEVGTCQISRLDPDTLTEQASVPTVCADQGLTTLTSVGDAIWFIDSTGAAADGTGQHLRRIDPATNTVDASSAGNLTLPIPVQFVNVVGGGTLWSSTSAGLIFGNRATGLYRLLAGSETFDPLGTPGAGLEWYAAGDGVWTTTNTGQIDGVASEASFYNGGDDASQTMGYDGYLAGADDTAVFIEYREDDTVAPSLVRYPIVGGGPAVIAVGGFAQNSFGGQTTLGYDDSLINPLVLNGQFGVKSWTAPSASEETMSQLLVQQLQLP